MKKIKIFLLKIIWKMVSIKFFLFNYFFYLIKIKKKNNYEKIGYFFEKSLNLP